MSKFVKGIELSKLFYLEAVCPILAREFPNLPYAAAKLGEGSDVLGFDTKMSIDHDWGPSLTLFIPDIEISLSTKIQEVLAQQLPLDFLGYSTHFAQNIGDNTSFMQIKSDYPVNHRVEVTTVNDFSSKRLGIVTDTDLTIANWLSWPSQSLLSLTAGEVFHDGFGDLTQLREKLSWYPHDVWLYLMASAWHQITENQPLMSRAGFVGDELGSSLVGSSLVRTIMQLCFLQEKRYAPYEKWFGTAFKQLDCATELLPLLTKVQHSSSWQLREVALNDALSCVAEKHNHLNMTEEVYFEIKSFFSRPFKIISGDFVTKLLNCISDVEVRQLMLIGNIDQLSTTTSLKVNPHARSKLTTFYSMLQK